MKQHFLWILQIYIVSSLFCGCSSTRPLNVKLDANEVVPQRRAMVFLIDGMRADLTNEMLADGRLPNIKKYLVDRGCKVENGVSCIPSITYATISSIITGRYPGHHDIMGNKWFDRVSGRYQTYGEAETYQKVDNDIRAATIYEILEDKYTVTIQTAHRRGATRPLDNWMSSGVRWFVKDYSGVDTLVATRFEEISTCAQSIGRWPDFIMAYFPGLDETGHRKGSDSEAYRREMMHIDRQIGRICEAMERNGMLDGYYMILISDHGHDPMQSECCWVPEHFFRYHLNVPVAHRRYLENGNSCEWHRYLQDYRVVMVNGGSRRIHVHLRACNSWINEPTFNDVEHFLERCYPDTYAKEGNRDLLNILSHEPGVGITTAKMDANNVLVLSAMGCGQVSRRILPDGTKEYAYQEIATDPLNYLKYGPTAKLMDGKFHDSRTWLEASCGSEYPDFVPQIVEMYDSPRAGQIVAFAAPGWSFKHIDHSGHSSVLRADMIVPFIIAGPGICRKTLLTARQVDIMPTILDMMGELDKVKTVGPIDGISLLPILTTTSRPACTTQPTSLPAKWKTLQPSTQPAQNQQNKLK